MLAMGNIPKFQGAAVLEQREARSPEEQVAAGDAWWTLEESDRRSRGAGTEFAGVSRRTGPYLPMQYKARSLRISNRFPAITGVALNTLSSSR